jgi:hypothetical protein
MRTWKTTLAAVLLWAVPAAGQGETETRTYTIHHALFGDIGTLSDEITRDGPDTKVITRAAVRVTLLGLTLHRVSLEWSEVWHDEMLMDYRATTTRNGSTDSIAGHHEHGTFIVRTDQQEFAAPADVHPIHPWSLRFVRATHLMSPESGDVFATSIVDKGDESLVVRGTNRRVRHYIATFETVNHLYFDETGTLLLAEYRDITGKVRFVLQTPSETAVASTE